MGIDPSSVNVSDVRITRPDRSGPGGDIVGTPAVLGEDLEACHVAEDRVLRTGSGPEIIILGRFWMDPVTDELGDVVPIKPGDLVAWTDLQGVENDPQEIISVEPTQDCDGDFDVLTFTIGRTAAAAGV